MINETSMRVYHEMLAYDKIHRYGQYCSFSYHNEYDI